MTGFESNRFLFEMGSYVFSYLHLVSMGLVEGDVYDPGNHAGEWGCKLWFTAELCPERQLSNQEKQGTIIWFSTREELRHAIDRMGSVRRQGASPVPIED